MSKINQVRFYLNISSEEYLKYYRQQVSTVLVTAIDGRRVRFPASLLRNHIKSNGIIGEFVLSYDEHGKAKSLSKIDNS